MNNDLISILRSEREGERFMNNDLISRMALKKEIENLVVGGEKGLKDYYKKGSRADQNGWIGGVYDAWELIKDAPTVEPTFKPIAEVKFDKEQLQEIVDKAKVEILESVERPQCKWMPVSEGLPNLSDRFLVTTRYGEVMTDYFTGNHFLQGDDIIAWQPLPEPYKKGGAE